MIPIVNFCQIKGVKEPMRISAMINGVYINDAVLVFEPPLRKKPRSTGYTAHLFICHNDQRYDGNRPSKLPDGYRYGWSIWVETHNYDRRELHWCLDGNAVKLWKKED